VERRVRRKLVTLTRDERGLLLHLRPGAGTNRANVHVRDDRTGMVKTVRLVVRTTGPATLAGVGTPQAPTEPAEEAPPESAPPPPAPPDTAAREPGPAPSDTTGTEPGPAPPDTAAREPGPAAAPVVGGSGAAPAAFGSTMVCVVAAGLWFALTGIGFVVDFSTEADQGLFLRDWDYGPGLGTTVLGGTVLFGVAAVGLARLALRARVRRPSWRLLLGLSLGLAAPLTVERGSMSFRWAPETWFFEDRALGFAIVAVLLGTASVGMCVAALRRDGAVVAQGWAPPSLVRTGVLAALLWGAGSAVPVYDKYAYTRSYFDVVGKNRVPVTVTMILLVVVLATAVLVGGRLMAADAGRGVVAGAAVFLVALEIIEVATLFGPEESRQGGAFLWMFVPATVYVGTIVRMLRRPGAGTGEVS
jgi:hypothetical protein